MPRLTLGLLRALNRTAVVDMSDTDVFLARLQERLKAVEDDHEEFKRRMNGSLERIDKRLAAIEREINRRPSVAMATLITVLSSTVVGLMTYLFTVAAKGG